MAMQRVLTDPSFTHKIKCSSEPSSHCAWTDASGTTLYMSTILDPTKDCLCKGRLLVHELSKDAAGADRMTEIVLRPSAASGLSTPLFDCVTRFRVDIINNPAQRCGMTWRMQTAAAVLAFALASGCSDSRPPLSDCAARMGALYEPVELSCDGVDNNCDGTVDVLGPWPIGPTEPRKLFFWAQRQPFLTDGGYVLVAPASVSSVRILGADAHPGPSEVFLDERFKVNGGSVAVELADRIVVQQSNRESLLRLDLGRSGEIPRLADGGFAWLTVPTLQPADSGNLIDAFSRLIASRDHSRLFHSWWPDTARSGGVGYTVSLLDGGLIASGLVDPTAISPQVRVLGPRDFELVIGSRPPGSASYRVSAYHALEDGGLTAMGPDLQFNGWPIGWDIEAGDGGATLLTIQRDDTQSINRVHRWREPLAENEPEEWLDLTAMYPGSEIARTGVVEWNNVTYLAVLTKVPITSADDWEPGRSLELISKSGGRLPLVVGEDRLPYWSYPAFGRGREGRLAMTIMLNQEPVGFHLFEVCRSLGAQ